MHFCTVKPKLFVANFVNLLSISAHQPLSKQAYISAATVTTSNSSIRRDIIALQFVSMLLQVSI